jgi:ABC-type polysaccharide/polyol phosphate transport system ATPase subunit
MAEAIEVAGVWKRFRREGGRPRTLKEWLIARWRGEIPARETFWALQDVSLRVAPGEAYGVIGANGSGKSTLLKVMAGILRPERGHAAVRGRVASLLELGAGFHPDLSGRENVFLNGLILGMSRREIAARFDEIVAFAELAHAIEMPVRHYSSGMYTRLGFAVAAHSAPQVLLVDEVLAVGDAAFQQKCHDRIALLQGAGATILLVSHDTGAIKRYCQRACWLEQGVVAGEGSSESVIDAYYEALAHAEERRWQEAARVTPLTNRWGSREVTITQVMLVGADKLPRTTFTPGEWCAICIHYSARQPVDRPLFGISIHRQDGLLITGANTGVSPLSCVADEGVVSYEIARMPLLPGTYQVSAAIYDATSVHAYDHHDRLYPLVIRDFGRIPTHAGLVDIEGTWHHET